jgi:hypothetical protein
VGLFPNSPIMAKKRYEVNPTDLNSIYKKEILVYVDLFKILPKDHILALSRSIYEKQEKTIITFHETLLLEAFKKLLVTQ